MVGKPVHVDDGLRNPPSPAIGREVRAWVKEDMMPLMGKESGGSRQQPPVAIAGGSGVVDVAMEAGEPRRGMIRRTTGVVAATNAVMMLGGSVSGLQWELGGT